jgi:uncharacterized protein (TIGR03435 family)
MHDDARMIRCLLVLVLIVASCSSWARAQTPPAASHSNAAVQDYDVATVKVNNTGSGSVHIDISNDILQATNVSLGTLLEIAFDIRREQIADLPHWAQVDRYDIAAKVVDMDPQQVHDLSDDQQRTMLQHLLDHRFHLEAHTEKRTLPLLELTVSKEGVKFDEWRKPVDSEESNKGSMRVDNDEMTAVGVPMDRLIRFLASQTHMPVVDKTCLKGIYNFHVKWQREEEGPSSGLHDQALPTIYAALPEQLGLKLVSDKGPVDVLVVGHIEQPSGN